MVSVIGLLIDILSFIFAVMALPLCTLVFWLSYRDPVKDLEDKTKQEDTTHLKGEIS